MKGFEKAEIMKSCTLSKGANGGKGASLAKGTYMMKRCELSLTLEDCEDIKKRKSHLRRTSKGD